MNTITKTFITVEPHCLQLPYASLRFQKRQQFDKLVTSMERAGQLVPIVVVPKGDNLWTLIDGHLRLNALRRIGKDIVDAEVWHCDEATALIMLFTNHQSKAWCAFEEALLLNELHIQHGLSQSCLANKIGRDQSWVSRRLSLLGAIPESVLQAVLQEKLSAWSAVRVFVPMARAMPNHAELLLQYVLKCPTSTRELNDFYDHYQQSPHKQRAKMAENPSLFFKAQQLLQAEKKAKALQPGPEGKWCSQLSLMCKIIASLLPIAPKLFAPCQEAQTIAELFEMLNNAKTQLDLLIQTTRSFTDAYQRHTPDHHPPTPKWEQQPYNCPPA